MKLKKLTNNEPVERLAVSVKKSTSDLVEAYREHYKATYGEEIERSQLVEYILNDYIKTDKAFMKAHEAASKAAK